MFALLMEDVYQFKKLIYLCGNMEKAAKIQKILLSGSPISFSQSYFALDDSFFASSQFLSLSSQFRFKVEEEWHQMQVSIFLQTA